MDNKEIAKTIVSQLGGFGKLRAMVGADDFIYGDKNLTFDFKGSRKMNMVKVQLTNMDDYDITFYKFYPKKGELKEVGNIDGIYAEQLKVTFESFTGLYLSL